MVVKQLLKEAGHPLTAKYMNAIMKDARTLAAKYKVPQDTQDIQQIMLAEATRLESKFDTSKGTTFYTYIVKPIRRVVHKVYGFSHPSYPLMAEALKFMDEYNQEHGVYPSAPTLAKGLDVTETKVSSMFFGIPHNIPIDNVPETDLQDNEEMQVSDLLEDVLERVTKQQRDLLVKYFMMEYSAEELAVTTGQTVPQIINEINAAVLKIRQEVANV